MFSYCVTRYFTSETPSTSVSKGPQLEKRGGNSEHPQNEGNSLLTSSRFKNITKSETCTFNYLNKEYRNIDGLKRYTYRIITKELQRFKKMMFFLLFITFHEVCLHKLVRLSSFYCMKPKKIATFVQMSKRLHCETVRVLNAMSQHTQPARRD